MAKRKYHYRKNHKKNISTKAKVFRSIILFILLILVLLSISFLTWKSKQIKLAETNSQIVNSGMGPIEYKSIGNGPIILLSHMGGSGSDNIEFFKEIADAGYRIICPSRPGYLQTPLADKANFEYQADLFAELLKQLNISEKVFVMGISAGGPAAIEFASKHADKCKGLILHSAITKHFSPIEKMKKFSQLFNIMISPTWQNVFSWANYKGSKIMPKRMIQEMLERATTYNHDLTKNMANELVKDKKNIDLFHLFNDITSPLSIRTDGLQNDLKQAENYVPGDVNVPALITHSKFDKVVDVYHSKYFKEKNKAAEIFNYDGYGHAFWFGKEWEEIKNKTLTFLKKYNNDKPIVLDENIVKLTSETWVSKINGALLNITLNNEFTLDFPGVDDKKFIKGSITFVNETITFLANKDSNYCNNIKGLYKFKIKKTELILTPVKDDCVARKEHFSSGWFKL